MTNYSITDNDMTVSISGPNSPYQVTWSPSWSDTLLTVTYSSTPIIIGGVGEVLTVDMNNVDAYKSAHDIPISSTLQYTFEFEELEAGATSQSASTGASYTFLISILLSLSVSLLTGGSMELMWSLANTLQIIFLFGMLNLYYNSDLKTTFEFMAYSNLDNPATRYLSQSMISGLNLVSSPVNAGFDGSGFGSTYIIANSLDKLIMILLFVLFALTLSLLVRCQRNKNSYCARKVRKMDMSVRYESITRFYVEIMLHLTVAALINIVYGERKSAIDIV